MKRYDSVQLALQEGTGSIVREIPQIENKTKTGFTNKDDCIPDWNVRARKQGVNIIGISQLFRTKTMDETSRWIFL